MFFVLGLAVGFMIGFVCAVAGMVDKQEKEEIKRLTERVKKNDSIDERLKKVKAITAEQVELQSHASGPQKNALHGKHKNGVIGRIKQLEEEKAEILRSILRDGLDPELTTIDESGVVQKMKLSEYMVFMGYKLEAEKPKETPKEARARQLGKFTVYKGGKDDGGETTH